ncbi:MAG: response regulator transcription factor [Maricaulis sp.]|jgi:two-component system response regulator DesR|nr:response regulator transcription factor [Maricaulis sp.]MDG2044495.1 response regulator transcription factor [Maricaulis sp.]
MIKIILAEDQSLLRGALSTLLALEDDIEVIAQAEDGRLAYDEVVTKRPDVLVTDIEMPGLTGIELAEKIRDEKLGTKILIVTTFARSGYLKRAMDAGVGGYVLKDTPSEELADAVRKVHSGVRVVAKDLVEAAWSMPDPLSNRERQILRLVEAGKQNKEIALELNLSSGTVRNYLAEAMSKLGASNRVEAFRSARQNGWL